MRLTIKDIAAEARVSVSTVSKCLNGYSDVSKETKQHVLSIIEQMDYVPNTFARYMSQNETRVIGLTVPDVKDPYFAQSTASIEKELEENGYRLFLGIMDRREDKFLDFLKRAREMRFDGIIITPESWSQNIVTALQHMDMPIISLRRRTPEELSIPYIDSDHRAGAFDMLNYIYAKGHRKIAHVRHPNEGGALKAEAYKEFCKEKGIEWREVFINRPAGTLSESMITGRLAAEEVLRFWPDTSVIFSATDFMAVGIMSYLKERGLRVPEDISVSGVSNMEMASLPWLNLTTMELHRGEMGKAAADMMLSMIRGEDGKDQLFKADIIERESVRSLN